MDVLAHDAKGTGLWLPCFQTDDDVMPAGVWCLRNVSAAGIGLGMGVAMCTPDDFQPLRFRSQFSTQMLFGVDRVHQSTVGDIGAWYESHYF